jgi:hypothetical protein
MSTICIAKPFLVTTAPLCRIEHSSCVLSSHSYADLTVSIVPLDDSGPQDYNGVEKFLLPRGVFTLVKCILHVCGDVNRPPALLVV